MVEIHVGDIGTKFIITILDEDKPVDISAAALKEIIFQKPDNTNMTKTASLQTDGTDGKMFWMTTLITDLDQEGQWKIQGKISIGGGTWKTQVGVFRVYGNIV